MPPPSGGEMGGSFGMPPPSGGAMGGMPGTPDMGATGDPYGMALAQKKHAHAKKKQGPGRGGMPDMEGFTNNSSLVQRNSYSNDSYSNDSYSNDSYTTDSYTTDSYTTDSYTTDTF